MGLGRNLKQVYDDNPSSTLEDDDLLYSFQSPYGANDDTGIKYGDLKTQLQDDLDFIHTTGEVEVGDIPIYGADGKNAKSSGVNIDVNRDMTNLRSAEVTQDPTTELQLTTKQYVDERAPIPFPATPNAVLITDNSGDLDVSTTLPSGLTMGGANSAQTIGGALAQTTVRGDLFGEENFFLTNGGFNPNLYEIGTISQSGNTITGIGTTFTADMVGGIFEYTSGAYQGTTALVTGYSDASTITVSVSRTVSGGTTFK
jgi:hypothetical protein